MSSKLIKQLSKQYVSIQNKIALLEEQAKQIKEQVSALAPDGVDVDGVGKWQPYSESVRLTYAPTRMQKVIDDLVLNGNGEIAQFILQQRNESVVAGGIKFIKQKEGK